MKNSYQLKSLHMHIPNCSIFLLVTLFDAIYLLLSTIYPSILYYLTKYGYKGS